MRVEEPEADEWNSQGSRSANSSPHLRDQFHNRGCGTDCCSGIPANKDSFSSRTGPARNLANNGGMHTTHVIPCICQIMRFIPCWECGRYAWSLAGVGGGEQRPETAGKPRLDRHYILLLGHVVYIPNIEGWYHGCGDHFLEARIGFLPTTPLRHIVKGLLSASMAQAFLLIWHG